MCGRYTLRATPQELAEFFELFREPDVRPRYNIAPSQQLLAIRFEEHATPREPVLLRWGLIPSWAKDAKIGYKLINARAETVATKPSFRTAFRRRRCLIPADGYYEWQKLDAKRKQPYHITLESDGLFAFAGLWERWEPEGAEPIESCTIITTAANAQTADIHDRMPVILPASDYDAWLDPAVTTPAILQKLLQPWSGQPLKLTPVSPLVNNPRNDSPDCLQPLAK